jgi:hypothetical protein
MARDGNAKIKAGIGGHHRGYKGRTDDWLTPPSVIEALGAFDLDPCCPPGMPWVNATTQYTVEQDGRMRDWQGRVWLNPPYGPETAYWLERLAGHGDGIALIFARTETAMFQSFAWSKASGLLFLAGRLNFYHPDGTRSKFNAGAPSVLIAYGEANARALQESGIPGAYVAGVQMISSRPRGPEPLGQGEY